MTPSTGKNKFIRIIIAAVFWIIVWEAAAMAVSQELILPAPLAVVKTFFRLCGEKSFWISATVSLLRILAGLLAGIAVGTLLAALTSQISIINTLFAPIVGVVRATPVASFIILALLWIGKSRVPGFIAALMVIPVIWGATQAAVKETDRDLLEMAKAYSFSNWRTARLVYIPSVLPSWNAACVTAMGLAWKAGIAAEVLCQPRNAIGSELYYSRVYLETPELFAWTALVVVLSFILEYGFNRLMKGRVKL